MELCLLAQGHELVPDAFAARVASYQFVTLLVGDERQHDGDIQH